MALDILLLNKEFKRNGIRTKNRVKANPKKGFFGGKVALRAPFKTIRKKNNNRTQLFSLKTPKNPRTGVKSRTRDTNRAITGPNSSRRLLEFSRQNRPIPRAVAMTIARIAVQTKTRTRKRRKQES